MTKCGFLGITTKVKESGCLQKIGDDAASFFSPIADAYGIFHTDLQQSRSILLLYSVSQESWSLQQVH